MPIPRPTCRLTITLPQHLLDGPAIELLEYVSEQANKAWPKLNKVIGGLRYAIHSERIEYDIAGNPYVARMISPQRRLVASNRSLKNVGFSVHRPQHPSWYLDPIQRGPSVPAEEPEPQDDPKEEEKLDEPTDPPVPPPSTPDAAEAAPDGGAGDAQEDATPPADGNDKDPTRAPDELVVADAPEEAPKPQPTTSPKAIALKADPNATCSRIKGVWTIKDSDGRIVGESSTARAAWQEATFKLSSQ